MTSDEKIHHLCKLITLLKQRIEEVKRTHPDSPYIHTLRMEVKRAGIDIPKDVRLRMLLNEINFKEWQENEWHRFHNPHMYNPALASNYYPNA